MDLKINPDHYTLIALIIVFFAFGMIIGYVAHQPEKVEIIKYVNKTVEVPTIVYQEKIVTATPTPTSVATVTVTPALSDYVIKKLYDPETDRATKTIEVLNWAAYPKSVEVRPKQSVLIKITETKQSPLAIIFNETDLGKKGAVLITFNNKGTYKFKVIIPSGDPNIISRTFAEGTITVS